MPIPNPIAFSLFGIDIRWYGILIALAILLAILIVYKRASAHDIHPDDIFDILLVALPLGIIGARLYYVIFNWSFYQGDWLSIINLRGGGLAIHGGLIFGFLGAYLVLRKKGYGLLNTMDMALPAVALAQAIGRWGNYFNSEAHGGPTDLPWAITVMGQKVHPTFLYESLWCFALFLFLFYMDHHRKFVGQVACLYGILYSLERFFVEGLRTDSLMIGPLRQAQVLSLVIIVVSLILYIYLQRQHKGENK